MTSTDGKKILVAEDENALGHALELKLSREGFVVTRAANGEEAEKHLTEGAFDLVLLDLVMPKENGFQVLEFMREKEITTPVIVLSNLGQGEDIEKANALGVKDFFIKSNTPLAELIEHIQKILTS